MRSGHNHRRNNRVFALKNVRKNAVQRVAADVVVTVSGRAVKMACLNGVFLEGFQDFFLIIKRDFVDFFKLFLTFLLGFLNKFVNILYVYHNLP